MEASFNLGVKQNQLVILKQRELIQNVDTLEFMFAKGKCSRVGQHHNCLWLSLPIAKGIAWA